MLESVLFEFASICKSFTTILAYMLLVLLMCIFMSGQCAGGVASFVTNVTDALIMIAFVVLICFFSDGGNVSTQLALELPYFLIFSDIIMRDIKFALWIGTWLWFILSILCTRIVTSSIFVAIVYVFFACLKVVPHDLSQYYLLGSDSFNRRA